MMRSRSRILLFLLFWSFSSTSLFPFIGKEYLPWYKKDYNILLMLLSAVGLYEYCGSMNSVDPSRVVQDSLGITQDDLVGSKKKYFEQLTVNSKDCMQVPVPLRNLHNYELRHMNAVEQNGPSCAWYMAFNARAIQAITQQQQPLTAANIREYVTKQLVPLVKQNEDFFKKLLGVDAVLRGMRLDQTRQLVAHLGVTNYYDIYLRKKTDADSNYSIQSDEQVAPIPVEVYDARYLVSDVPTLLKSIKQDPAPVVNILLTVPSSGDIIHVVLLTIIKRGNKKPLLVYLNSNGNSLDKYFFAASANTENSYITGFIKALDNT